MPYQPTIVSHPVKHARTRPDDWPDDMKAALVEYCATEMSYMQITAAMNAKFTDRHLTRNAVLGKASRLHLRETKPLPRYSHSADAIDKRKQRNRKVTNGTGRPRKRAVHAPVVFGPAIETIKPGGAIGNVNYRHSLKSLRPESDKGSYATGPKKLSYNDPALVERRKGRLPSIIETKPLTSRPMSECDKQTCKWPTSDDVRCMEVCGVQAEVGAYCVRHAQVAYRIMPTGKRNARFHKRDEYDVKELATYD